MKKPLLSAYLSQFAPGILTLGGVRMAFVDVGSGFWSLRRQLEALLGESATRAVFQQAGADGGASYAAAQGRADDPQTRQQVFAQCLQAYQAAGFGQFEILTADWLLGRMTVRGRETFEAWMMSRHGQRAHSPVCAYTAGVLVGFVNVVSLRRDIVCIEGAVRRAAMNGVSLSCCPPPNRTGKRSSLLRPTRRWGNCPANSTNPNGAKRSPV